MNDYTDLNDWEFDLYQEYIMDNGDNSEVLICNGDTLLCAAEAGYLFEEFVSSLKKLYLQTEKRK